MCEEREVPTDEDVEKAERYDAALDSIEKHEQNWSEDDVEMAQNYDAALASIQELSTELACAQGDPNDKKMTLIPPLDFGERIEKAEKYLATLERIKELQQDKTDTQP